MLIFGKIDLEDVGENAYRMKLVKKRTNWAIKGMVFVALLGTNILLIEQKVQANSWTANSQTEITQRLNNKEHSFTFTTGDTFYEVSQVLNVKFNKLMALNGFKPGEQYQIPIGTKIRFSGDQVSVTSAEGVLEREVILTVEDKVNESLPFANQIEEPKTDVRDRVEQEEPVQVVDEETSKEETENAVAKEDSLLVSELASDNQEKEVLPVISPPIEVEEEAQSELEIEKQAEETDEKLEAPIEIKKETALEIEEIEESVPTQITEGVVETEPSIEVEKKETVNEFEDEQKNDEITKEDPILAEEDKTREVKDEPILETVEKEVKQRVNTPEKQRQVKALTGNQTLLASRQAAIRELTQLKLTTVQREQFKKEVNRGKTVRQINGSLANARRLASKVVFNQQEQKKAQTNLLSLLNKERQGKKVVILKRDTTLDKAAQIRAQEIKKQFTHNRPNGSRFYTSVSDVLGKVWHSSYNSLGENLATASHFKEGQAVATDLYTRWKASPSHYNNMVASKFNSVGMALVEIEGTIYAVTIYGNK
ncbi:CAP domain-containing protein [Vagococcus sp.]|uniref:CAP domain-containing protein n=1 Tax=Vagococcus sp. TaxID=1933889 RepID=UPI003F986041